MIEVEARSLDAEVVDLKELDVTVAKREFVITGDDIYVPKLYEDAPQWMKDLVQLVVDSAVATGNASTLAQLASMLNQFATSYVPLNQYTQSILDLSNADANIHAVIETLNSNYNNGLSLANAQIISLQNTKASKDEVIAQVVNTLASQLANPTSSLGAVIGNLQQTIVNNQNANALSMQTLTASLNDVSGNVSANSSAITGLQTSVSSINGTLTSQAGQITNLRSDLTSGTGTWAAGDTNVTNTVKSYTDGKVTGVESKWAYNSSLNINGVSYNSGFGLATSVNSPGSGIPTGQSEFWINASKFKFTNTNKTGSKAPFTIEDTGVTPEITFNGKVTFSNVTNTSGTGSNLLYNSAPKIGSETKGWQVWTNSGMTVNLSAGWDIWKPTGGASVAANISGSPSIGSVFDVGQSSKFPVIAGSRYEASAYISAHRTNSHVLVVFYDASGSHVGEVGGNVINYIGSSALVNWGRSSVFTTAPVNAATAKVAIRSVVTGDNPYCFVAYAFAGVAETNQTTPSNWSEGTSAGATYTSELLNDAGFVLPAGVADAVNTNTTTINGSKITTGSITANQIAVGSITANRINTAGLIAENISATTITGKTINGSTIEGSVIKATNIVRGSYIVDQSNNNYGKIACSVTVYTAAASGSGPSGYSSNFAYCGNGDTSDLNRVIVPNNIMISISGGITGYGAGSRTIITLYLDVVDVNGSILNRYTVLSRPYILAGKVLWSFGYGGNINIYIPQGYRLRLYIATTGYNGDLHQSFFNVSWNNM